MNAERHDMRTVPPSVADGRVETNPAFPDLFAPTISRSIAAGLDALPAHEALLARFATMHLDRVRHMRPLAGEQREDRLPRARRRAADLPSAVDLEGWYRILRQALDAPPNADRARCLVATMLHMMRGRPAEPIVIEGFVLALGGARLPSPLIAGAVQRALATCRVRPSPAVFLRIAETHRAEVRAALDLVTRTMGLRKDAETIVSGTVTARP